MKKMTEFDVIIERDSDGYLVGSVPSLPGCHTQARSQDELIHRLREAIELYLEVQEEEPSELEFVGSDPFSERQWSENHQGSSKPWVLGGSDQG